MCAKNHLLIFSSFLDIWENVEWPRFLDHPVCNRLCSLSTVSSCSLVHTVAHLAMVQLRPGDIEWITIWFQRRYKLHCRVASLQLW